MADHVVIIMVGLMQQIGLFFYIKSLVIEQSLLFEVMLAYPAF